MNTRTNIVLDDDLIAQAMVLARVKTKKAAVEAALKAYVKKPDYSGLLALRGSGVLADDYDPDECYLQYPIDAPIAAEPSPSGWLPSAPAAKSPLPAKTGAQPGVAKHKVSRT